VTRPNDGDSADEIRSHVGGLGENVAGLRVDLGKPNGVADPGATRRAGCRYVALRSRSAPFRSGRGGTGRCGRFYGPSVWRDSTGAGPVARP